jgi:hypothetical protein
MCRRMGKRGVERKGEVRRKGKGGKEGKSRGRRKGGEQGGRTSDRRIRGVR